MADYTPPEGSISLAFDVPYTPPTGSIVLLFGESTADSVNVVPVPVTVTCEIPESTHDVIIEIISDQVSAQAEIPEHEVEIYYEIVSDSINVSSNIVCIDVDGFIVSTHRITIIPEIVHSPLSATVVIAESEYSGGKIENLPSICNTGLTILWNAASNILDTSVNIAWNDSEHIIQNTNILADKSDELTYLNQISWDGVRDQYDNVSSVEWDELTLTDLTHESTFVGNMIYADESAVVSFDESEKLNVSVTSSYIYPEEVDVIEQFPTSQFLITDLSIIASYIVPEIKDKDCSVLWGIRGLLELCKTIYYPPPRDAKLKLAFEPIIDYSGKLAVKFEVKNDYCPWEKPYTGPTDSIIPIRPIPPFNIIIVPILGFYYMQNIAFIRRISGNMESIDFKAVSMSIDRDSWLWSFNITILSKASLDLIKPQGNVLTDIEIHCNGWKWTCRVENWKENIKFGKRTWTVTGRSPSIELASPYSSIPTYSNTAMQGGQIIDLLLADTGWTAEWHNDNFDPFTEWLTPAGVLNVSDSSAIKTIQQVTDSISSFIQTNADTNENDGGEKKLIIQPTYAQNVWNWADMTPSVMLTDAICREIGRQNQTYSEIDSVIVTGENQGVIVNAVRDGYAGTKPAAMCIDAMITTREAGRERARHIISKSGFWIVHSLSLFSLMPPGDAPGLLLPGDFVGVNESGTIWKGQVTGTSITAEWGATGVNVGQTIEVEQYIGE